MLLAHLLGTGVIRLYPHPTKEWKALAWLLRNSKPS